MSIFNHWECLSLVILEKTIPKTLASQYNSHVYWKSLFWPQFISSTVVEGLTTNQVKFILTYTSKCYHLFFSLTKTHKLSKWTNKIVHDSTIKFSIWTKKANLSIICMQAITSHFQIKKKHHLGTYLYFPPTMDIAIWQR